MQIQIIQDYSKFIYTHAIIKENLHFTKQPTFHDTPSIDRIIYED